ncbi:MAG: DUF736 family protein [Amphiplicatus sp.]
MSTIGYVKKLGENRFEGAINGLLTWRGKISLRPLADGVSDNAPEMEIVAENGVQLGTARYRTSQRSGERYVNLAIKHPQIVGSGNRPIFANLGPANDQEDSDVYAVIAN